MEIVGLVIIGGILIAIISAFIFSEKFRKDVIASEGEASVFGMINVKGVIIVLLTAIFCGAFIWIMDNKTTEIPDCLSEKKLIELENRLRNPSREKDGYGILLSDSSTVVSFTPKTQIAYKRNAQQFRVGQRYTLFKTIAGKEVFADFWFKIDTIKIIGPEMYSHEVIFGEGEISYPDTVEIIKTAAGVITDKTEVLSLNHKEWKHSYTVMMALGYPWKKDKKIEYLDAIDRSTVILTVSNVEK